MPPLPLSAIHAARHWLQVASRKNRNALISQWVEESPRAMRRTQSNCA